MLENDLYSQLKAIWQDLEAQTNSHPPLSFLENLKDFPLSDSQRSVFAIFNFKTFRPEYFSENCLQVLGYSHQDPMTHGSMFFLTHLSPEHKKVPIIQSQWLLDCLQQIPFEEKVNMRLANCGMQFSHPQKKYIRLLFQHQFYDVDENRNPVRALVTITDVSHLLKNDSVWFRLQYGNDVKKVKTYDFQTHKALDEGMISKREKDILSLIAQGKDATAISKELFISINTVNNHRQNMLNRLNVKDTTALIQICHFCGII